MNKQTKTKAQFLIINTGSTSTKIAVYEDSILIFDKKITHTAEELNRLNNFDEQVNFRLKQIKTILDENNYTVKQFEMIMARGGLITPVKSGVYKVNFEMLQDLKNATKQHASNLAAVIGYHLSNNHIPVYIADPVVVDEMHEIARYAGHPLFQRKSVFHALNHKAVGRKFASEKDSDYKDLNLIIAHLGGGISVGAHQKGQVIDVNQALDGEGAFSPERSGTLPAGDLVRMSYSGKYSKDEMLKMITGKGGLVAYTGSNDLKEIEEQRDSESLVILKAMAYQVAKSIGEMATVLKGSVDGIILTGGVAYSTLITGLISERVKFIAPVYVYPGENEMWALAQNGLLLYENKITAKIYKKS